MTALRAAVTLTLVALPSLASAETVLVESGDNVSVALGGLKAGDELVFAPGTFDLGPQGLDVSLDGAMDGRIVIRGSAGTILEAPDADLTLRLSGQYVTIEDLEIHGPGAALTIAGENFVVRGIAFEGATVGIDCEDCAQVSIVSNSFTTITDTDLAAIYSEAFVNGEINANWIHDVAGHGVVLAGRTVNADVLDNVVELGGGDGIHVEFPTSLAAGQANSVYGNYVADIEGTGIVTLGGVVMASNIVTGFGVDGITATLGEAMTNLDALISGNTVVGTTTCFRAREWPLSNAANVVANNAFYCDGGDGMRFEDGSGMNTIITRNIYLGAADVPGDSQIGNGLSDFVDAEGRNFYPSSGSPLIDAGDPTYDRSPDFNGEVRDATPDIGAYEVLGSTNPGVLPGGGFKGADATTTPTDADMGMAGDDAGGLSGGAMSGGTSDFPDRKGGCGCSSAGPGTALFPLFFLAFVFGRRRR